MRVLQLIDSLAIGGAERVAVNLTNSLNEQGIETWLCATREEGPLQVSLNNPEKYLFLGKKKTLDWKAVRKLSRFIRSNNIHIIHAHSSSYFLAVWVKWLTRTTVIWHDHYGNSEQVDQREIFPLNTASLFFDAILCVNDKLAEWARLHLFKPRNGIYTLPNFPKLQAVSPDQLPGKAQIGDKLVIICLANLRPQKDHLNLLQAVVMIKGMPFVRTLNFEVWLVGTDYKDSYSAVIKEFISNHELTEVRLLGARTDVAGLLALSHIGVLSSESEGFPVALMEYGMAGLPTICSDVGQCREILDNGNCGILVPPKNAEALANGLTELITYPEQKSTLGAAFHKRVISTYSSHAVIQRLISVYQHLY